jgi:hypothetical protein
MTEQEKIIEDIINMNPVEMTAFAAIVCVIKDAELECFSRRSENILRGAIDLLSDTKEDAPDQKIVEKAIAYIYKEWLHQEA